MIFSFSDPSFVYPIFEGTLFQITRISSKREPECGDLLRLYYRDYSEKSCYTCLNAETITGRKCPLFDPKTYSRDMRCPRFINFLGYAKVINVEKYECLKAIPNLKAWARNQGFKSIKMAKSHYSELMGKEWENYPLTVISWELSKLLARD